MKTHSIQMLCVLLTGLLLTTDGNAADQSTMRIVLAGDSTVAEKSGWGAGFAELLSTEAECINLARSGRSSRSYRAEGWWQKCLQQKPNYLLIQFGHNDQPGKGSERESAADGDFRDHLRGFIEEAREAGSQPVLITPLTRRRWNDSQQIEPTLAAYATAATAVAAEQGVPLLDLNRLSIAHANATGPEAFRAFEPMTAQGADHTHLNSEGSRVTGRIVATELVRLVPELAKYVTADLSTDSNQRSNSQIQNAASGLRLTETDNTITISSSKADLLVYNKTSPPVPNGINPIYHRSAFLHPVASPAGRTVTAAFPFDHPHQHGVFSAWVRTEWNGREIDFWNLAGGTGRVAHQRVISIFSDDADTGFEVDMVHRAVQPPVVDVLRERWKVTASPTDGTFHCFDIESVQTALTDLPLIVKEYHYGGMAFRGTTRWLLPNDKDKGTQPAPEREGSHFVNDQGSDRKQGNHQKSRWVALSGQIDGSPVSITVLCHADNFRAPQAARLHPTKPYFCFSPCVDGEFVISREHPVHARYRYLVTDAEPDAEWLNEQWQAWCGK